jgi:hypothetical protein
MLHWDGLYFHRWRPHGHVLSRAEGSLLARHSVRGLPLRQPSTIGLAKMTCSCPPPIGAGSTQVYRNSPLFPLHSRRRNKRPAHSAGKDLVDGQSPVLPQGHVKTPCAKPGTPGAPRSGATLGFIPNKEPISRTVVPINHGRNRIFPEEGNEY